MAGRARGRAESLARGLAEGAGAPGTVLAADAKRGLVVACAGGAVELQEIQAPGGKRMDARAYLLGKRIPVGERLEIHG